MISKIISKFEDNEVLLIYFSFERENKFNYWSNGSESVFKCLLGLYNIDSGEIKYDGRSSSEMNDFDKLNLRRDMGWCFKGVLY